jgi:hypothetical protein
MGEKKDKFFIKAANLPPRFDTCAVMGVKIQKVRKSEGQRTENGKNN